jgi:drug/metabolite transporter (DMT)-like permease
MGLGGTCFAFVAFYYLMSQWGAGQASLINYFTPIVGLSLGIMLGEATSGPLLLGASLILFGIVIARMKGKK